MKKVSNFIFIFLVVAFFLGGGYLLIKDMTKPLPGTLVEDLGRDHVEDIFAVEYNSNPPTSGPHFPIWAKKGVYDRLISDGYLIHSLEHGYIVISYNCEKLNNSSLFIKEVLAHDEPAKESTDSGELLMHMKLTQTASMSAFTPQNPPDEEIPLPESFKSESCQKLVSDLAKFLEKYERIIIVPRINVEKLISVTGWRRIIQLDSFKENEINEFVRAFHNKGPEKTVE